jgi:phosphate-selective porin OprO and OprP
MFWMLDLSKKQNNFSKWAKMNRRIGCLVISIISLTVSLLAAEIPKIAESVQPGFAKEGLLKFKGYVQTRYEAYQLDGTVDTFKLKSAYFVPYGTVLKGWDFEAEIDAADIAGKPLRNAFVEYVDLKPYAAIRIGQQKPSYSEEFWTSSSSIDTIERALAVTNLSAERDIGINVLGKLLQGQLEYGLGIFNGNSINATDNNENKDVVGRIVYFPFYNKKGLLDALRVGGAFWTGHQPKSGASEGARNRYDLLVSYQYERLKLQSEYLFQKQAQTAAADKKSNGWYLLGTYDLTKGSSNLQLVAKVEQFDPDKGVAANRLDVTTLGINYFFNKYTKIMANYRFKNEQALEINNDEFLTQLQVKF